MKTGPSLPRLIAGKRSVIFADISTGILLTPEGERYIGEGKFFILLNTNDEATVFAQSYVQKHPLIECSIRDENGDQIRTVRIEG
jgi:hypothetical protein